jgi:basic amino acid/polyamine antiporter, APA family
VKSDGKLPALLTVAQASAIVIGIVVGIGIFKTPPIVAANAGSETMFLGLWVLGGLLTLVGALCYAELAAADPSPGGEYRFLSRAYGDEVGFLFMWGRISVMQTGAIAAVGFAYGDYASTLIPLGTYGSAIHAASAVLALSFLQIIGTGTSGRFQVALTVVSVALILLLAAAGLIGEPSPKTSAEVSSNQSGVGLAMVFILVTYGGWNEAAYLSGEIRDVRKNMSRVLVLGTLVVVALYVVLNVSLLYSMGLERLAAQKTVTGPLQELFGPLGGGLAGMIICIAALSTLNGTLFTGARSIFALGRTVIPFARLARTHTTTDTPAAAILFQAAISLLLIAVGAMQRDGFTAMVEYTAPTFWAFMLLVGMSLFIFRYREPGRALPLEVPLYPITPVIFCATSGYLLYASVAYTGWGGLIGVAILLLGIPLHRWVRSKGKPALA